MLKLSKKVDYGLILLSRLSASGKPVSAREMAERDGLPLPMVANLLKALSGAEILISTRGAQGGYVLNRNPRSVTLAQVVQALDGPVHLVDCVEETDLCQYSGVCPNHSPFQRVQEKFQAFLEDLSLDEVLGNPVRPLIFQTDHDENTHLPR